VVSFKVFTAYAGFRLGDEDVLTVLEAARRVNALVCFHAEDGLLINYAIRQLVEEGCTGVAYYPDAHPKEADLGATYHILSYARHLGSRIHIVHVNTREAAQMIGAARRAGFRITGETSPQYLVFTEDVFRGSDPDPSYFVLAPSMRTEEDRQGLWEALLSDDLQMVASDHCPYTSAQKLAARGDFRSIPGGIAGVETILPLLHTCGVLPGRFSMERLAALTATNPARIFNLYPQKGTIAVGSDADLVVFDPHTRWTIQASRLHSRTDHSVYENTPVVGKTAATILRGEVVAVDGDLAAGKPTGRFLSRMVYG
jgi:dihydropyrimidinase